MEKTHKINKDNLEVLKKKINDSDIKFDSKIALFLLDKIYSLNFNKFNEDSFIKIKGNQFIYFNLKPNGSSISLKIELFNNTIEMYVADAEAPVYDQYLIKKNRGKIIINLNKWLSFKIYRSTSFCGKRIKKEVFYIVDSNQKDVIHKSFNLKFLFCKTLKVKHREYNNW